MLPYQTLSEPAIHSSCSDRIDGLRKPLYRERSAYPRQGQLRGFDGETMKNLLDKGDVRQ